MWGFFCFLNAGFDFAIAAIRTVHVYNNYEKQGSAGKKDIESTIPFWLLCTVLVISWLAPLTEAVAAYVSYLMYLDVQEQDFERAFGNPLFEAMQQQQQQRGPGAQYQSRLVAGGGPVNPGMGGPSGGYPVAAGPGLQPGGAYGTTVQGANGGGNLAGSGGGQVRAFVGTAHKLGD